MRALILGTQSFLDRGTKVGSQYLAEHMARHGWEVDYVPTLSSPADILFASRRPRFRRAREPGLQRRRVIDGLIEWSLTTMIPPHRLFLRTSWQIEYFTNSLPSMLTRKYYDLCISDVCPNMLFVEAISASVKVCRLNDWPMGFVNDIHEEMIAKIEHLLRGSIFSEIWAVSGALEKYAKEQNPGAIVIYMPNAVDISIIEHCLNKKSGNPNTLNSAVYVGALSEWFDYALVEQVAAQMAEWDFAIYGKISRKRRMFLRNLHWMGPVSRDELPSVLSRHSVGLIPFKDLHGRLTYVEKPLKFYEYLAAGLGVASTDVGSLRHGMQGYASFGNGVEGFVAAIVEAAKPPSEIELARRVSLVAGNTWDQRAGEMIARLRTLR